MRQATQKQKGRLNPGPARSDVWRCFHLADLRAYTEYRLKDQEIRPKQSHFVNIFAARFGYRLQELRKGLRGFFDFRYRHFRVVSMT